jgi:cell pole-organizing protein PopZ
MDFGRRGETMAQTAKVQEPSMEEILASIRRIIADDGNPPGGTTAAPHKAAAPAPISSPPKPAAPPASALKQEEIDALITRAEKPAREEREILELTQTVEPALPTGFRPVSGTDVTFREGQTERPPATAPAPMPAPSLEPPPAPAALPSRAPAMIHDDLMSPPTTAAVSAAFGSLATTILSENARTLEDLVQEMMRPMLKDWLDENLPGMVERMVRAEIERVSRGGR